MKFFLNLITIFFIVLSCYGQNLKIQGTIVDDNNKHIPFSNITLVKNNIFIKGTTSDDKGYFEFLDIEKGDYQVTVSVIGYKTYKKSIFLNKNIVLKTIVLNNNVQDLNEVILTLNKPIISQKKDRLVFNIEKTILSDKNSWEIIQNTPTVFISQDLITVNNSQATIFLNNKKVQLKSNQIRSFLEGLKGQDVKAIEVISNPSAKYDANIKSIINIVTIKKQSLGYKGSVNGEFEYSLNSKYTFGTSHYYTTKKIDFFANYNYSSIKDKITMDEFINYRNNDNELKSRWLSFYDLDYKYNTHDLLFNIDYRINKSNKLSLSANTYFQPNKVTSNNTVGNVFDNNNVLINKYEASSPTLNDNNNYSFTLDYTKQLGKKGKSITTEVTYNSYNNKDNQYINTDYYSSNNVFERSNKFKVNSNQNIKIYLAKIDYTVPLKNKTTLDVGVKSSFIETKSYNNQYNKIGDDYIFNTPNSDSFNYDETNYAVYTSINKEWDKWFVQLGVRGEQTKTLGNSVKLNILTNDNYFKLFPSLYLNYYPNKSNSFTLNYSKRIERPKYRQLNPFKSYFSDFAVNIGNPSLKPAISHKVDFTYILNGKHRLNLFYHFQNDKSEELSFQDNEEEVLQFIIVNLKNKTNTGFNYFSNISILKRWVLTSRFTFYYKQNDFYLVDNPNILKTNNVWREIIQLTNNFTFLKDKSFTTSLRYVYASPSIKGSYIEGVKTFVNIDFKKRILKNKGTITLSFRDIFNTYNSDFVSRYNNQDNGYFQKNETRQVKLSFIYNFGNKKLKANNKTKSSSETKRADNQ